MPARRTWELAVCGAEKLLSSQCLFGFSQRRMRFCDLRLRNCQTSHMHSFW
jgi:hypothetical protein